jgi:poly(hydroxyalkanoate) depolymerase family esterase
MKDRLKLNKMFEATRLTRGNRLTEATALLQQMLRGEAAPVKTSSTAAEITRIPAKRKPSIIHPNKMTEETVLPFANTATTAQSHGVPRLNLVDRVKRLRSGLGIRGLAELAPVSTPNVVPEGGKFIEATYDNSAGSRTYKLYIPGGYRGQAIPLVVMLHGGTQSPNDFAAGTRMNAIAEEQTCLVAYPEQPSNANAAKCWNWFRPSDQRRGQGEPSLIAGITRQVMRDYSVDPQRVYIGGLSAGGAAAVVMGATYSDLYAAIGVHSGLAHEAAHDLPSAFGAMKQGALRATHGSGTVSAVPKHGSAIPTIVFHGDRDTTVHPRNGDHVIARAKRATNLQKKVHRDRAPGGHSYTRTIHSDASGRTFFEQWEIHGAGHAWSGGSPAGSFTDPRGPDATREMLRFFFQHAQPTAAL